MATAATGAVVVGHGQAETHGHVGGQVTLKASWQVTRHVAVVRVRLRAVAGRETEQSTLVKL